EILQSNRRVRQARAMLGSIAGDGTYSMSLYRSNRLRSALRDSAREESPSWFVAHSYHVGPFALEGGRSWIDFHNVDSEIWRRLGAPAATSGLRERFARQQASRVAQWEKRLVSSASGISCVSDRDARILSELGPRVPPVVVPNGVDLEFYVFRAAPSASPKVF